jgi:RNA polymerase sigma-70 factor (ECF subfamily)
MIAQPTTDAIWSHLNADLRQFIRRKVSDDHAADDLLQETFLRIHRNIGGLREGERLAAWVYQIARNVVHDHYRSTAKSSVAFADSEPASDPGIDESRPAACHGLSWLNEMVALLPEGYREAVELGEVQELPQQEIATRLGLSLPGAKSRIQRGRAMLKDLFQQCCTVDLDGRGRVMECNPKPNQSICGDCGTS